jgi:hypothetical protein
MILFCAQVSETYMKIPDDWHIRDFTKIFVAQEAYTDDVIR